MIARTEFIGATNGASRRDADRRHHLQAVARDQGQPHPPRPDVDGRVVPTAAPFLVGGDDLMYPGDPSATAAA
jgi:hypothetical protein